MSDRTQDAIESVWDYPRPPLVVRDDRAILVEHQGNILAKAPYSFAVKETSHPPCFYVDPRFVRLDLLTKKAHGSFCEFKGRAVYWSFGSGQAIAWSYPDPEYGFASIGDHFCFYASRVDACWVGGQRAEPQEGDFYGGWITPDVSGPFKGGPGTRGW